MFHHTQCCWKTQFSLIFFYVSGTYRDVISLPFFIFFLCNTIYTAPFLEASCQYVLFGMALLIVVICEPHQKHLHSVVYSFEYIPGV